MVTMVCITAIYACARARVRVIAVIQTIVTIVTFFQGGAVNNPRKTNLIFRPL
jgi:hypothetical protein